MTGDLVERIYEAAFVPDHWPVVLDEIGALSGSSSGALQIIRGCDAPIWASTELIRETLHAFIATGLWRSCKRPAGLAALDHAGFVGVGDDMSPSQLERDPVVPLLGRLGLGWQVATLIAMPSGESVGLTFERRMATGVVADGHQLPGPIGVEARAFADENVACELHGVRGVLAVERIGMVEAQEVDGSAVPVLLGPCGTGVTGRPWYTPAPSCPLPHPSFPPNFML